MKLVESLRNSFSEELENLGYINDNFVDDSTLSFSYNSEKKKIILKTDAHTREIDATDFIYDGMIESVDYDKKTHKLTITFNTRSGKEPIIIDISDLIDVYNAGNGLCCENQTFSIDENIVSQVGHKHEIDDINNINQLSTQTISEIEKKGYTTPSDFNIKYDKLNNTLHLSVGTKDYTTEISATGGSGGGISYEDVKNELSNDGYGLNVIFRDWS